MTDRYGYANQGFGSRSLRPRHHDDNQRPIDPLTDSAIGRGIGMGNRVRFHLWGEDAPFDVHLLDLVDVANWRDVTDHVRHGADLEVRPPNCALIKGNAYRWVELLPPEDG
jgi:hypothetical protein